VIDETWDRTCGLTASLDKTAIIWNAVTGQQIGRPLTGHTDELTDASFSPDGARILTSSRDGTARLWDVKSGRPIGQPLALGSPVGSAVFSPDGRRIITASDDKTARQWDSKTGEPIGGGLEGHEDFVTSVAFSPDDQSIITASLDSTARLWDANTGKPFGILSGQGAVWSAAFSPYGRRMITASADKVARIWEVLPRGQTLIDQSKAIVPRCLTMSQRKQLYLSTDRPSWCIDLSKWPYDTEEWKKWLTAKRQTQLCKFPSFW
jgi:WD40 repeat protein